MRRSVFLAILFLVSPSLVMSQEIPATPLPLRTVLAQMNKHAKALAKGHKELRGKLRPSIAEQPGFRIGCARMTRPNTGCS